MLAGGMGSMMGTVIITNIGGLQVLSMPGWRFAFLAVAVFSAMIGVAMWLFGRDPRCPANGWRLQSATAKVRVVCMELVDNTYVGSCNMAMQVCMHGVFGSKQQHKVLNTSCQM